MVSDLPETFFVECDELAIYGYGETYDAAMRELMSAFDRQYRELVEAGESATMTPMARSLRNQIVSMVVVAR